MSTPCSIANESWISVPTTLDQLDCISACCNCRCFRKGFIHIPDFVLLILWSDLCSANVIFQMQSEYFSLVYNSDKLHIDLENSMMPYSLLWIIRSNTCCLNRWLIECSQNSLIFFFTMHKRYYLAKWPSCSFTYRSWWQVAALWEKCVWLWLELNSAGKLTLRARVEKVPLRAVPLNAALKGSW